MKKLLLVAGCLLFAAHALAADRYAPALMSADASQWKFCEGDWKLADGILEQKETARLNVALLKEPAFKDFELSVEFKIHAEGKGVRAAAIAFRATGTRTYYWLHLDSHFGNAILVRSTPGNSWIEILRRPVKISQEEWHRALVTCTGSKIEVHLDGKPVLEANDAALAAGRIGFGTSEGHVEFRHVVVNGSPVDTPEPLKDEQPPYRVISRGELSGPYQAFPDACRLKNGDIACVFYAGYGHISLPTQEWPRGGRICLVTSSDEGNTWSAPRVLFDGPLDDRDPHLAQTKDGTLYCSFFTYRSAGGREKYDTCLVTSRDGGKSWDAEPTVLARDWACSAPVRELSDGTYLLGVYTEANSTAFGGVVRSTDRGKTWSEPIAIDPQSGVRLDAETDVIELHDGTIFAALRGDKAIHMHASTSADRGRTWSPVKDLGFLGHCPHLTRLSSGEILLTHRLPNTALHVSRDDGKTWQGPVEIDGVIGAYPATVELKDHSVLVVYYEEGSGSGIRMTRFRVLADSVEKLAPRSMDP